VSQAMDVTGRGVRGSRGSPEEEYVMADHDSFCEVIVTKWIYVKEKFRVGKDMITHS
jgi:hypothetical protein